MEDSGEEHGGLKREPHRTENLLLISQNRKRANELEQRVDRIDILLGDSTKTTLDLIGETKRLEKDLKLAITKQQEKGVDLSAEKTLQDIKIKELEQKLELTLNQQRAKQADFAAEKELQDVKIKELEQQLKEAVHQQREKEADLDAEKAIQDVGNLELAKEVESRDLGLAKLRRDIIRLQKSQTEEKVRQREVQNREFSKLRQEIARLEVFMLHMLYLEKLFHTLCSIEATTTIILWDIKRGNWLQSMNLKYPINAYINILHGRKAHNALLYTLIDF